jgi:UDP-N-acetylmuramoyl-tripeptide--D-alanyl-D-alanine ligase
LGADRSSFEIAFPGGKALEVSLPLPGLHNVRNAGAALAVAWTLDADLEAGAEALSRFQPPAMRSVVTETPRGIRLLNDAYNANPDSMRAALGVLAAYPPRRVAALGDMLELGAEETAEHLALGRDIPAFADVLVAVGPRSKATADAALNAGLPSGSVRWLPDSGEAAAVLPSLLQPGDTVLLKGSRGMKMERVAEALLREEGVE